MCVYSKTNGDSCVIVILYFDDMFNFGTVIYCVEDTKIFLSSVFNKKDVWVIEVILRIKIIKDNDGIVIS